MEYVLRLVNSAKEGNLETTVQELLSTGLSTMEVIGMLEDALYRYGDNEWKRGREFGRKDIEGLVLGAIGHECKNWKDDERCECKD